MLARRERNSVAGTKTIPEYFFVENIFRPLPRAFISGGYLPVQVEPEAPVREERRAATRTASRS